jgi:hypothetical protein
MTYDNHITVVGDFEKNPSNLIELVSKVNFVYTKDVYINVSDQLHLFYNPNVILLLAGEECSPPPDGCQCGGPYPCVGPILVYDPCNWQLFTKRPLLYIGSVYHGQEVSEV